MLSGSALLLVICKAVFAKMCYQARNLTWTQRRTQKILEQSIMMGITICFIFDLHLVANALAVSALCNYRVAGHHWLHSHGNGSLPYLGIGTVAAL